MVVSLGIKENVFLKNLSFKERSQDERMVGIIEQIKKRYYDTFTYRRE